MPKMQIELSYEDQVELEKICTDKEWTYSHFFKLLLEGYRKFGFPKEGSEKFKLDQDNSQETDGETVTQDEDKQKRRGRPAKTN